MKHRNSFKNLDLSNIKYDPITGLFARFHLQWNRWQPINPTPTKMGYLRAKVDNQLVMLHALAYFMMTGNDPVEVDHENRIKTDNRWINLRNCTRNANCINRSVSTGGATLSNETHRVKKWRSQIRCFGKNNYIGCFATKEEGQQAYLSLLSLFEANDSVNFYILLKQIKQQSKISSFVNYSKSAAIGHAERRNKKTTNIKRCDYDK